MEVLLNLATKPLESHRKFLAGSWLMGVVAAVIFAGLGWHVYTERKAESELRARTDQMQKQVDELERRETSLEGFFNQSEIKQLSDRSAFLSGIIHARSFNWTLMFMDLERILPAGVRVVSIEPKQDSGRVEIKLTVGATTDEGAVKLLKVLEGSKTFSNVKLVAIRAGNPATAGDPVIAELTAEYTRI